MHLAKVFAPERSGRLKRSINGTYNPSGGPFSCRMEVQASVRHALFVHEGTTGPIWASNNDFLKLRPGNGWPTVYTRTVAGQSANPFLRHALEEVMGHL